MKLSKKMLREMISETVSEVLGFTTGAARETEEEFYKRMKELGLATDPGEEVEYQTPEDPREENTRLKREVTRLQKMNLALINQLAELGMDKKAVQKTIVRTDPDADFKAATVRRKK
tara:strand:- start:1070 stop:1420 length:351 start_codon:yes stop_codon:yes gene_type:complete